MSLNYICAKDVSIVVQGAIDPINTPLCIQSLRKHLGGATVILSTWEGEKTEDFDCDFVIKNRDPGGRICSKNRKRYNNVARQIISTQGGLEQVTSEYTLKIRSDIILENDSILKIPFRHHIRDERYSIFSERLVISSIYSRLYCYNKSKHTILPVLFHPSDWIFWGYSKDIKSLFDINIPQEPDFSDYFKYTSNKSKFNDFHENMLFRYCPEQYLFYSAVKKNIDVRFENKMDITAANMRISRMCMLNNFYPESTIRLGIKILKFDRSEYSLPDIDYYGLFTHERWEKEYKRYLDKNYVTQKSLLSIKRLCYKIKQKTKTLLKWMFCPFLIIMYASKFLIKMTGSLLNATIDGIALHLRGGDRNLLQLKQHIKHFLRPFPRIRKFVGSVYLKLISESLPSKHLLTRDQTSSKDAPNKLKKTAEQERTLRYEPFGLIIDTTILCNNHCSFCWRRNNSDYLNGVSVKYKNNHTMDFAIYKKIIDDACQYESIKWLSLSGPMGEPLMNEHIMDFFDYASNKKHFNRISINTNGLAINRFDVSRLLNSSITEFSISIDSIDPKTYQDIHGVKNIEQIIDNVRQLVNYKKQNKCKVDIWVRFTENELNIGQFPKFQEFFAKLGVDYINYTRVHSFAGVNMKLKDKTAAALCDQPTRIINFDFLGNMATCCINWHLMPMFGNINNKSIKRLWESKEKISWNMQRLESSPCLDCGGLGKSAHNVRRIKIKKED